MIDRLFGVIDLRQGVAVHAVAGNRDRYRPVVFCHGLPSTLIGHYRSIGVSNLYLADLDSILGQSVQTDLLVDLIDRGSAKSTLIDIGWRGESSEQAAAVERIKRNNKTTRFVVATESATSVGAIRELADLVGPQRVFLSLDLRGGDLVDDVASESAWIAAAVKVDVAGVIVLDIARVGTSDGPNTAERSQRIKSAMPHKMVLTGGGVRSMTDVDELLQAGCDGCLVGTMLHQRSLPQADESHI